jgi:alkylhydroperoxidase family enzyme
MTTSDEREELVRLVTSLMSAEGTEEEQNAALRGVEARVLHPRVSNLIFWPTHEGFDRDLTPVEVVDAALAYRPIEL